MCPYRFPYRFTTGLRQVSDRFRRKSQNMYQNCRYKFPYRFPYRFTTGLLTTGFRNNSEIPEMFTNKCHCMCPYRFPYRFTTGLRQVSDIQRFHKCLPTSVTACVPTGFPTGVRQVYDRFPTGSGENQKIYTKNVNLSFPTGFPTGLRQVYNRFPT